MSDGTSEGELLQASLAGNKDAFGAVVKRYESLVCAITYSATGDIGKSQELAQETFLRAWKARRSFEGDENAAIGWLIRTVLAIPLLRPTQNQDGRLSRPG